LFLNFSFFSTEKDFDYNLLGSYHNDFNNASNRVVDNLNQTINYYSGLIGVGDSVMDDQNKKS
jgi:hypothetical protein